MFVLFLISVYCGVIFFTLYRVLKNVNTHRRVETITLLIRSGIFAFIISLIIKDVGNIFIIISTLFLILYPYISNDEEKRMSFHTLVLTNG